MGRSNTMWLCIVVGFSLVSVSYGGTFPVYSQSYANVRYQGADSRDGKEEVTTTSEFDEVNPTIDSDTATEPYSETVNATKTSNQGPKKLHEALELEEELETTEQPDLEPTDPPVLEQQGIYYIYHPNGLLQRIIFATKDDIKSMEYIANFNYQDVEPIVEPIYTYDPDTLAFQQLQLNYV